MPGVDGFTLSHQIKHDRTLRDTPVIMLTSVGRADAAKRARKIGVDALLAKPVKHSDLLDTLSNILGVATRRANGLPAGGAAAGPVSSAPPRPLHILVAEDNLVNRRLVTTLMQKRGHRVEAVENGREALAAMERRDGGFDVILMDVQMPEMGGFEAHEAIRTGKARLGRTSRSSR